MSVLPKNHGKLGDRLDSLRGWVILDTWLDSLKIDGEGVAEQELDEVILDAIGWNLRRCTGYVKYVNAVREVIRASGLVLEHKV